MTKEIFDEWAEESRLTLNLKIIYGRAKIIKLLV
jgi:hypothetical protein